MNSEERLLDVVIDIIIKLTKTKKLIWYMDNKYTAIAHSILDNRYEFTIFYSRGINTSDYYNLVIKQCGLVIKTIFFDTNTKNSKLFELYSIIFNNIEYKVGEEKLIEEFSKFL
ncbi:hypothetical protein M0R19_05805 [Candidatus Pacearchaeota archaeon]|jgi:hypothetical protein|nr:hypothetical protein [Candidatus Pacearchaeota archaeon]